jgi:two-component system sensor histidine kinase/response regulator
MLIESEEKFKSVFTYANDVMFIMDGINLISVNKNAESLFGYTKEKLINMTPADISPEFQEDGKLSSEKAIEYVNKALNGEPQFFEWIYKNSDGVEFPTEMSLNAIIINNKKYIFAVLRDITFRKILDETLKDKEKSLELALDGSELGYYDMNLISGKVTTNQTCYQMLGYDAEDVTQDRDWWRDLIHRDDINKSNYKWEEHLSGKKDLYQMEVRMKTKDGSYKWILDKSKIFEVNSSGSAIRVVGTHMDISQRKSYEEAILAAKESAEESNTLKSNFLTNMSHELRTPLTGILGFSELLSSELEDEEQKEMADLIFKGGKRLTNTLNSILDLSRLESNQLALSRRILNLVVIVEESIELYNKSAKIKGLYIILNTSFEILDCNVDEKMTYDIVCNLIQNAITYTNEGGITISLDLVSFRGNDFAQISVKDTGIGINQKYHKQIFEPFRQASEGLSRKFEGTGLGLTLTKKYTEMMGGEISVISEEGEGSEFIIRLPSVHNKKKEKQIVTDNFNISKKNRLNAIFIEDEIENYELVNMLLKPFMDLENYTTSTAALEIIKRKKYDIVFMDIGLKDINGIEATKIIRRLNDYKDTPIIAITAFAMTGDKEKIMESGCNEYISKPFTKDQLFDTLRKYIKLEE